MSNGFDALMRESLRERGPGEGGPCLDAEIAAAWFDGTLSAADRDAAAAHAAECPRCQAMLAALARTEPPMQRAGWRSSAMRWAAPIAAAAAAAAIWINVARRETTGRSLAVTPQSTQARAAEAAAESRPASAPAPTMADRPADDRTDKFEDRRVSKSAIPRSPDPAIPRSTDPAIPRSPDPAVSRSPDPAASKAAPAPLPRVANEVTGVVAGNLPPPAAAAPAAPPTRAEAQPAPAEERSRLAGAAANAPAEADRRMVTSADAAVPLALQESVVVSSARRGRGGVLITPADRTTQWRITNDGAVERSLDAGATWQAQQTGAPAALTAGASPSASVIWLVGRRGVVLVSSDAGQTWKRQDIPETLDLVGVVAADATTAVVTAAGGRQFRTTPTGWR